MNGLGGGGKHILVTATEAEFVDAAVDAARGDAGGRVVLEKVLDAEAGLHSGWNWGGRLELVAVVASFEA